MASVERGGMCDMPVIPSYGVLAENERFHEVGRRCVCVCFKRPQELPQRDDAREPGGIQLARPVQNV